MAIHAHSTIMPASQRGLLRLVPDLANVEALADAEYIGRPDMVGVALPLLPAEPDTAAQARALHARRELHLALDYGFALLDALDLSPRGLDIIDGAIARLDAMDAPEADLEEGGDAEPSLGWTPHIYQTALNIGDTADIELDAADTEDDDPAEETSLETAGRGFVRCGADDAEDDDPAERDEDHGSEDEAHPWRLHPASVAFAVQVAHG